MDKVHEETKKLADKLVDTALALGYRQMIDIAVQTEVIFKEQFKKEMPAAALIVAMKQHLKLLE